LVYEVDQDGNVIHLKTLEKPKSSKEEPASEPIAVDSTPDSTAAPEQVQSEAANTPTDASTTDVKSVEAEPWPASFDEKLKPFLSDESREKLKNMFLEGPEPPLVSDGGWAGRAAKTSNGDGEPTPAVEPAPEAPSSSNGRGGRGGRGSRGRGGRGGGRGGGRPGAREDHRKVISEVPMLQILELLYCSPPPSSLWTRRTIALHSTKLLESYSRESWTPKQIRRHLQTKGSELLSSGGEEDAVAEDKEVRPDYAPGSFH
jgi:hypothetical protein